MARVLGWVELDRPPKAEDKHLFVKGTVQITPQKQSFSCLLLLRDRLHQLYYALFVFNSKTTNFHVIAWPQELKFKQRGLDAIKG